jgi:hypothetical protein
MYPFIKSSRAEPTLMAPLDLISYRAAICCSAATRTSAELAEPVRFSMVIVREILRAAALPVRHSAAT